MKKQIRIHSILKVTLLAFYLAMLINPSFVSAQNTEPQEAEQSQDELNRALFTAVTNGLIDEAENLIAQGVDVNVVDEYGRTPLHIAASAGHIDIVKLLIAHGARLDIKDNAGRTPLHYAVGAGSAAEGESSATMHDIIRILLDNNVDINTQDNSGFTPLYYAADRRNKNIVKLLIDNGADSSIVDNRGRTPYQWIQEKTLGLTVRLEERGMQERISGFQEIAQLLKQTVYYISTNGKDGNPGTLEQPFSSVSAAIRVVEPGDTVLIRGGTYLCSQTTYIDNSGLPGKPIYLRVYPGETSIFDCSAITESGFVIQGAYWHIKGIIISDVHTALMLLGEGAHHNVVEQVVADRAGIVITTEAAHNLIVNCDTHQNVEFLRNGDNADGFAAKFSVGVSNTVIGGRSWNNSDDGYDFWYAGNPVRFERCYAWGNGVNIWNHPFFTGNGNGFKLGGGRGNHILINCVAWGNPHRGFDLNANREGVILRNCTGWDNGINYYFTTNFGGPGNMLRNNLSYKGQDIIGARVNSQSNSWDAADSITLTDSDFLSLDDSMMSAPRNPDGSIPQNNFLKLASTSEAIDAGTDVNMPFIGKAPDLGAFEYNPNENTENYVKMLHQYVRDHDIDKINETLEAGTDINEKDWLGYSPLHWACYFGYADLVTLLIDKGADPNLISDTGRTSLEIATAMDYQEIAELLKKHEAK